MTELFSPYHLADLEFANRIVMAPMTRTRAQDDGVPTDLMADYFAQRASAGLIVTDCTWISEQGCGIIRSPGIATDAHVGGWQRVTDAVHAAGGKIFLQIWHCGRVAHSSFRDGALAVAPSALAAGGQIFTPDGYVGFETPRSLETSEVLPIAATFGHATRRARAAGFDGVELHGAFGYLIDQFLQDVSNHRDDIFGGSVPNRCRFLLEAVQAAIDAWEPQRVGVKLSPGNTFYGMGDSDAEKLFAFACERLSDLGIAYIHLMEPPAGSEDTAPMQAVARSLRPFVGTKLIANGGLDLEGARALIDDGVADLVAFGVPFIANPDLVTRLQNGWPLAEVSHDQWYGEGPTSYTDFPAYRTSEGREAAQ